MNSVYVEDEDDDDAADDDDDDAAAGEQRLPRKKHSGGGDQLAKTKGGEKTEWQCVDVYIGLFTFLCVYTCFSSICYNVMLMVG